MITTCALMLVASQLTDSVRLCVRDASSGAGVVGATVRVANAAVRTAPGTCILLSRDAGTTVVVTRVGYAPQTVMLGTDSEQAVTLVPRTMRALPDSLSRTTLATQQVSAARDQSLPGRVQATVTVDAARERGAVGMAGVISLLPFTTLRSARGETGLSLRGARREQVVITLDGLPLNDPATGLADVSDLPLAALQSATVQPGADPVGQGSGAAGGVLALTTAATRLASVHSGAFGQRGAEMSWTAASGAARWNASAAYRSASNDFDFVNNAGAAPVTERRVNNDERRAVLSAGVVSGQTQWNMLASIGERGMVGAANVRTNDADRSRTSRLLLRGQTAVGTSLLTTGARLFQLRYRDPTRPALDAQAQAWAGDVEWKGAASPTGYHLGMWRVGAGADGLTGTGNVSQRRTRGFAAWQWQRDATSTKRVALDAGVRADVVEGSGLLPTASAGATLLLAGVHTGTSFSLVSRFAQAVRVPTLYDLYFSSPQRLSVRALSPERVTLDASGGMQGVWVGASWRGMAETQLVARNTRDAIVWFPGNFGWSPANVGREQLRGSESRAEISTAATTLGLWHTWYNTTLHTGGLSIPTPYVPTHSLGMQGLWRAGAYALGANARYQGRRPFTAGPRNTLFELPAVTLLDLSAARRLRISHVDLLCSIGVENAANVRWQSVRGFPMPGRGWSASLTLQPRP